MTDTKTADWSVLEIDGVMKVAENAARKVARQWAPSFELEDVTQDAYLILSTKADEARAVLEEGGLGRLGHWLWCDLQDAARKANRRSHLNTSYDAIVEGLVE